MGSCGSGGSTDSWFILANISPRLRKHKAEQHLSISAGHGWRGRVRVIIMQITETRRVSHCLWVCSIMSGGQWTHSATNQSHSYKFCPSLTSRTFNVYYKPKMFTGLKKKIFGKENCFV